MDDVSGASGLPGDHLSPDEMLDLWQQGIQGMYEVINRVERMTRAEAEGGHFAKQ